MGISKNQNSCCKPRFKLLAWRRNIKSVKKKRLAEQQFLVLPRIALNFDLLKIPFLMHCRFLLALGFYSMFPWPFRISIGRKNLRTFLPPSGSFLWDVRRWLVHTYTRMTRVYALTHTKRASPFPIHQTYAVGYVLGRCYSSWFAMCHPRATIKSSASS